MAHQTAEQERRRHGRIRVDSLRCQLGRVVNISGSGLRVHGRGWCPVPAGTGLWLELRHPQAQRGLKVRALVCDVRPRGLLSYSVGMEFIGISARIHVELLHLMWCARLDHRLAGVTWGGQPV